MSRILVVDDESSVCWGLARLGESLGHEVATASSAEQGLTLAESSPPDLLILDVRLPGMDGLAAMKLFRHWIEPAPIIVITAFGDLSTAVTAVEQGAFEYVLKPFDLHEIRTAIERALRASPVTAPTSGDRPSGMLGQSSAMQGVFKQIALAAASDAEVLLFGETGVGKELAAAAIHKHSMRRDGPFVAVNVAALSPSVIDAELFGHVAGAFTGATEARKGLLVAADGGTLFFDEVADIPLPLQVKLLRALDQGEVLPVGADRPVRTDFRVISATHQDLRKRLERGEFRHDLYYRLCTFTLHLPPLRERVGDIRLLADSFAEEFSDGKAGLVEETHAELERRPWFGNVRELRNAVEHAVVLARRGTVLAGHLPPPMPSYQHGADGEGEGQTLSRAAEALATALLADSTNVGEVYQRFLSEVELPLLVAAMNQSGQQCAPAARALGLHRTTLKRKLDEYGIAGGA